MKVKNMPDFLKNHIRNELLKSYSHNSETIDVIMNLSDMHTITDYLPKMDFLPDEAKGLLVAYNLNFEEFKSEKQTQITIDGFECNLSETSWTLYDKLIQNIVMEDILKC